MSRLYVCRQALRETNLPAAHALSPNFGKLLTMYRIQFPVMRAYEAETWCAPRGRIVFTPSTVLEGGGLSRQANRKVLDVGTHYSIDSLRRTEHNIARFCEDNQHKQLDTVRKTQQDRTLLNGPWETITEYHAFFFKPNREENYRATWDIFLQSQRR